MRGAGGMAVTLALHSLGLGSVFDVVVGVSTGAPIGAYFLAGSEQARQGVSVYCEDLPPRFIKYHRSRTVDIDFLESLFRIGSKKLNVRAIKVHRSQFYVAVTEAESGIGRLIDAKAINDPIAAIKASVAMPGLYWQPNDRLSLGDDTLYLDGALGDPFPIEQMLQTFRLTDLLIVTNRHEQPLSDRQSLVERSASRWILHRIPAHIRSLVEQRNAKWRASFQYLESLPDINCGILWAPQDNVHILTRKSARLRAHARASADATISAFGGAQCAIPLL